MKYDWEKIISDQQKSGLSIGEYCELNGIADSSFYKNRKKLQNSVLANNHAFTPVEVVEETDNSISMNIDGHVIIFDSSLLGKVIGALK